MSADAAFERLREVNPVPRPEMLRVDSDADTAELLSDLERRRRQMQTDLTTEPRTNKPRSRRAFVAAAVAVIALGVVAVVIRSTAPNGAVANGPDETAALFLETVNTYDAEASTAMLAPQAVISDLMADSVDTWAGRLAWGEAVGLTLEFEACDSSGESNTTYLTCPYTFAGAWSDAAGLDSSGNGSYAVKVESGEIGFVSNVWFVSDAGQNAWLDFLDWVDQNHPGDLDVMFSSDGLTDRIPDDASAEPASIDMWHRYLDEYLASQGGGG